MVYNVKGLLAWQNKHHVREAAFCSFKKSIYKSNAGYNTSIFKTALHGLTQHTKQKLKQEREQLRQQAL